MFAILIYVGIMGVGIFMGKRGFLKNFMRKHLEKTQTVLLLALLFIMGIGLGKNKAVIHSLADTGVKAFIMALAVIIGSVISLLIANRLLDKIYKKESAKRKK